ncbi:hypothetical protein Ciccas_011460 [Cichlidogyrus casuarinus]|uniref:SWIM-type domain-containing protein n=1 Tax=Cichlidogyrus casuarinus TaxID=1844966 RepID=A0ABD2PR60_9PLAT
MIKRGIFKGIMLYSTWSAIGIMILRSGAATRGKAIRQISCKSMCKEFTYYQRLVRNGEFVVRDSDGNANRGSAHVPGGFCDCERYALKGTCPHIYLLAKDGKFELTCWQVYIQIQQVQEDFELLVKRFNADSRRSKMSLVNGKAAPPRDRFYFPESLPIPEGSFETELPAYVPPQKSCQVPRSNLRLPWI